MNAERKTPARKIGDWDAWLAGTKGRAFSFQRRTWRAISQGHSGLVVAPTGFGKTYAVWGGAIREYLRGGFSAGGLRVLWITPLRALAADSLKSLRRPVAELGLPWTVETRTGDTAAAVRKRQKSEFPTALVTTPESLSLLLSYEDTREKMAGLQMIIVDEWHQLLGTKRGVQTELCLARLRAWFPEIRTWGMTATPGDRGAALRGLLGSGGSGDWIEAKEKKKFILRTLLPRTPEKFPLAGHSGLGQARAVAEEIAKVGTTLLFTNTRSQAEMWYQALLRERPEWADAIGLHHGSLDRAARGETEAKLAAGNFRCVVCTASLDLGVDFSPVSQVIQVGGPKGVARMLQRAGRSGHEPGGTSTLVAVPAHAMEFVEFAAARDGAAAGDVESQAGPAQPFDVLSQHLVTIALGGGFFPEKMFAEVKSTAAYADLTDAEWRQCLEFISRGGPALSAYPRFQRVEETGGLWRVADRQIARDHRLGIGTITSESAVAVRLMSGKHLGSVEESFIGKMRPGDGFTFAGKPLVLVRLHDMTATVRVSTKAARRLTRWMGSRMSLSSELSRHVRRRLQEARDGFFHGAEMRAAKPALAIQARWSRIPGEGELLIETLRTREGHHHFLYPFAGRLANEGLAALLAHRIGKLQPLAFSFSVNDYGFSLTSSKNIYLNEAGWRAVLTPQNLVEDTLACLNTNELARRHFREIARIAGLVFQGFPGQRKKDRQIQASSGLFYEVFERYDPENPLLGQARAEVIHGQLEAGRLAAALREIAAGPLILRPLEQLTPLSFPLWAGFIHGRATSENEAERVRRMAAELETLAR